MNFGGKWHKPIDRKSEDEWANRFGFDNRAEGELRDQQSFSQFLDSKEEREKSGENVSAETAEHNLNARLMARYPYENHHKRFERKAQTYQQLEELQKAFSLKKMSYAEYDTKKKKLLSDLAS
jgi:hypothetical protein